MYTKLFIDDERNPVDTDAIVVRNSAAAIQWIVNHQQLPNEIMFDHDLGGDDTSRVVIHWLSNWMIDRNVKFPKEFTWSVHSQNPIGREYINGYMANLVNYIGYED